MKKLFEFVRRVWATVNLSKVLDYWQGAVGILISLLLFWVSGYVVRFMDPSAGSFDYGYLQKPILTLVYLLFLTSAAWIIFQIEFPSLDKWLDRGGFEDAWDALDAVKKIDRVLLILAGILVGAIAILISL